MIKVTGRGACQGKEGWFSYVVAERSFLNPVNAEPTVFLSGPPSPHRSLPSAAVIAGDFRVQGAADWGGTPLVVFSGWGGVPPPEIFMEGGGGYTPPTHG